jgi:hypothetical protein
MKKIIQNKTHSSIKILFLQQIETKRISKRNKVGGRYYYKHGYDKYSLGVEFGKTEYLDEDKANWLVARIGREDRNSECRREQKEKGLDFYEIPYTYM